MTIMTGQFGKMSTTGAPKGVYKPIARVTGVYGEELVLEALPRFLSASPELVLFRDESGNELVVDMRVEGLDARCGAYRLFCAVQNAPDGVVLSLQCGRHQRDDNFRERFPFVGLRVELSMRVLYFACCSIASFPILSGT